MNTNYLLILLFGILIAVRTQDRVVQIVAGVIMVVLAVALGGFVSFAK